MDAEKAANNSKQTKPPSFKGVLSTLAIVQAMLATSQLVFNVMTAMKAPDAYKHEASRTTLQFTAVIVTFWFVSAIVLLFALFSNRPWLILFTFGYNIFLFTFHSLVLLVLIFTFSEISSILLNLLIVTVLLFSIVYEWKCFVNMQVLI